MLDEQTTVLTNLGSSEEATLLRAKMQSRSLLSDTESFKVKLFRQIQREEAGLWRRHSDFRT
jgi:hypothetical protein